MDSKEKVKIALTGNEATALVTLYAKYHDNEYSRTPILGDKWAGHVLSQVDCDIKKLMKRRLLSYIQTSIVHRAFLFDKWTTEFLSAHALSEKGVTVLHLACGIDSRSLRLQHLYEDNPNIRWIDVDLSDVVELRRKLLPVPKGDYRLLASDVMGADWLEKTPNDRPTVVVFEGLMMYLSTEDGMELLQKLLRHFPTGQLLFDVVSPRLVSIFNLISPFKTVGGKFKSGIENPRDLERLNGSLKLLDDVLFCKVPGFKSWLLWFLPLMWGMKKSSRFLRYEF